MPLAVFALTPVFFVLALGYWAGWRRLIDNRQVRSLNLFVMNFTLPAALFVATAQTSWAVLHRELRLVAVLLVSMWSIYALSYWMQRRVFGVEPGESSVRTLTVAFPNFVAIGLPFLDGVLGPKSAVDVAIAIAAGSVLLAPITLVILAGQTQGSGGTSAGRQLARAVGHAAQRPVVLGPLAGVAVSLAGWQLPALSVRALSLIGVATPGAALFLTGLVLSAQPIRLDWPVLLGIILKGVVQPALAFGLALLFGMHGPAVRVAVLLMAVPTGFFGIMFGLAHDVKSASAGSTLTLSSVAGIVTLTLAILLTNGLR